MVPPAGEMSSRDQSGSVLVRTYPGTVCGGLGPVGGGSRGRRGTVPSLGVLWNTRSGKGLKFAGKWERCFYFITVIRAQFRVSPPLLSLL